VPFIVRWPARVPANTVCEQTVELTDVLATVAAALGRPLPDGAGEDSRNLMPLLSGEATGEAVREYSIHHSVRGVFAIRRGPWKLIPHRGSGGFSRPRRIKPRPGDPEGQLYNLAADPSETTNLWSERPEVVRRLSKLLEGVTEAGRE